MDEHSPDSSRSDAAEPQPRNRSTLRNRLIGWSISLAIIAIVIAMLLPAQRTARESARRVLCINNMRILGVALHNYHNDWGFFPPPYTTDEQGKPLHSWRTLLLPYIGRSELYDKIDLAKPWDDPVNAEARNTVIPEFLCPSNIHSEPHTCYVAIVGDEFAFSPTQPRAISDFKDGLNNTVMVMEVPLEKTFEWMSPHDANEQTFLGIDTETKLPHLREFHVLLGDGKVQFVSNSLPAETRRALLTTSGGERVGKF